jgi:hypothetical protein
MPLTGEPPEQPVPVPDERAVSPGSPPSAPAPATLLLLLLAADALFVALHLAHVTTSVFQDPRFSLEVDRGFAEVYQYLKEYWIALLLILVARRRRAPVLLVWALLFGYLLWDDAFMIHERLGAALARELGLSGALSLGSQDVEEALVALAMGALALAALALTYVRSDGFSRRASRRLLRLLALLALFGVAVDVLHEMLTPGFWHAAAGTIEDGGELVVMSLIVSLVADLYGGPGAVVEPRPEGAA